MHPFRSDSKDSKETLILDDIKPRGHWLTPDSRWGRRIVLLTLVRTIIIGAINILLSIWQLHTNQSHFNINGSGVTSSNPMGITSIVVVASQLISLMLIWDACIKKNSRQVKLCNFLDFFLVGHLIIKTNRRFQIVNPNEVNFVHIQVGLDLVLCLLQGVHSIIVFYIMFCNQPELENEYPHLPLDKRINFNLLSDERNVIYDMAIAAHKLLAGLVIITAIQISGLFWHRSIQDMISLSVLIISSSLIFNLIGLYSITKEKKYLLKIYCTYLISLMIICAGFLFLLFSVNQNTIVDPNQPLPQQRFMKMNFFTTGLYRHVPLDTSANELDPNIMGSKDVSGDLPSMFKDVLMPILYLTLGVTLTSLLSALFSFRVMQYFGNHRYTSSGLSNKFSPHTMFVQVTKPHPTLFKSDKYHHQRRPSSVESNDSLFHRGSSFTSRSSVFMTTRRPFSRPPSLQIPKPSFDSSQTVHTNETCLLSPPAPVTPMTLSFPPSPSDPYPDHDDPLPLHLIHSPICP